MRASLIIPAAFFLIGLAIGSFLNMLIFRLPRPDYTPLKPRRSVCPECTHELSWKDNIPLLSFIFLRGKCRYCQKAISPRYFIVELLASTLFLVNAFLFEPFLAALASLMASGLILVSFIDLENLLIPDSGIVAIGIGALGWSILTGRFPRSLLEAALVFGVMFVFFLLANRFKSDSFGFGDVELLGVLAIATGIIGTLFTVMIGSIAALVVYTITLRLQGKKMTREMRIPFGPFLAMGGYISLLLLPALRSLYGL